MRGAQRWQPPHLPRSSGALTHALLAGRARLVARAADAAVAAPQVLTQAVSADVGVQGALVNVCGRKRAEQPPGSPAPPEARSRPPPPAGLRPISL